MALIAQPDGSGAITADAKVVPEKIEPGQDGDPKIAPLIVRYAGAPLLGCNRRSGPN
jgi:hypothetical protein